MLQSPSFHPQPTDQMAFFYIQLVWESSLNSLISGESFQVQFKSAKKQPPPFWNIRPCPESEARGCTPAPHCLQPKFGSHRTIQTHQISNGSPALSGLAADRWAQRSAL